MNTIGWSTHEVSNQAPELVDYNLWRHHRALRDAVAREGGDWAEAQLDALGAELGRRHWIDRASAANRNPPQLRAYDRFGHRIDQVEFHPAYHELMALAIGNGLHASPWAQPGAGAHVARAAGYLMFGELENGVQCPVTMTFASVPALRREAAIWQRLGTQLLARDYDPRLAPIAAKPGMTIGMGMTEKQGGSDVRSNTTVAQPNADGRWRLTGHKWFFSAPMCDAFLVLARTDDGPTCFFVPRVLDDGALNALRLQRLKDKVGNRSNASSEVEFHDAIGERVGEPGRGIPTILEMGTLTRFDCALGSAGILHQAVSQAVHHARHRSAFGRRLIEQPLMRSVLADLALESEAATALTMRLARSYDSDDPSEIELRRVLTPAAKFWICKRLPQAVAEAMEVHGGNGYVDEAPIARLYREAPLNSIWEGSGNVMCLDVLRALGRRPETVAALRAEIEAAGGRNPDFDAAADRLGRQLAGGRDLEAQARELTATIAVLVQAGLLLRFSPPATAQAFCATRLGAGRSDVFGQVAFDSDQAGAIIERVFA